MVVNNPVLPANMEKYPGGVVHGEMVLPLTCVMEN